MRHEGGCQLQSLRIKVLVWTCVLEVLEGRLRDRFDVVDLQRPPSSRALNWEPQPRDHFYCCSI